jgi:hypothetical protein
MIKLLLVTPDREPFAEFASAATKYDDIQLLSSRVSLTAYLRWITNGGSPHLTRLPRRLQVSSVMTP